MHDLNEWWVVVETTRTFEIDGQQYEIDLCGEHDAALDEALRPYLSAGRKQRRNGQAGRRSGRDVVITTVRVLPSSIPVSEVSTSTSCQPSPRSRPSSSVTS